MVMVRETKLMKWGTYSETGFYVFYGGTRTGKMRE
jgi:hypothetical protein